MKAVYSPLFTRHPLSKYSLKEHILYLFFFATINYNIDTYLYYEMGSLHWILRHWH